MTVHLQRQNVILEDGEFLVVLHDGHRTELSAMFLERRCGVSPETPRGLECVGACVPTPGGLWEARIAVRTCAAYPEGVRIVVSGAARLDALVSLWRARRETDVRFASP